MFLEAQELLMDSPWITNIDENSTDIKNDSDEIKVKRENQTKHNSFKNHPVTLPSYAAYNTAVDNITDIQFIRDELASDIIAIDNISRLKTSDQTSVIQSPDLSFSSE